MSAYPSPLEKIPVRARPRRRGALARLTPPLFLTAALLGSPPLAAQPSATGYQLPPKEILAIADAPPTPWVVPTPDRRSLLVFDWSLLAPISELAETELRLAGQRIQPRFAGPSRTRPYTSMAIQSLADGSLRKVTGLPPNPWLTNLRFSPSGKKAALTHRAERGWELWVVDLETAAARRLTQPVLNLTLKVPPSFVDESHLAALLVPEGRGLPPEAPAVPTGPSPSTSSPRTSRPTPTPTRPRSARPPAPVTSPWRSSKPR